MARWSPWAPCVATLLACAACGEPDPITEVLVAVDSDLVQPDNCAPCTGGSCEERIRVLKLDVVVPGETERTGYTALLSSAQQACTPLPVSWGLVDRSGHSEPIGIVLRAFERGDALDVPVVEKRVEVTFARGSIRVLCLEMDAACAGVTCPAGGTCVDGLCCPWIVDGESLPEHNGDVDTTCSAFAWPRTACGPPPPDAGPPDAGPPEPDAGTTVPDAGVGLDAG